MRFVKGSLSIKKEVPNKSFDHDNAIVTLFAGEWKQDYPSSGKKRANDALQVKPMLGRRFAPRIKDYSC